jgi:alkylation response protein AidB-like acyl-CoA dehydrogenase
MALAKVQATRTMDFCAREASQVFGGAACIRGGKGILITPIRSQIAYQHDTDGHQHIAQYGYSTMMSITTHCSETTNNF